MEPFYFRVLVYLVLWQFTQYMCLNLFQCLLALTCSEYAVPGGHHLLLS
jgi:hypothetical protein